MRIFYASEGYGPHDLRFLRLFCGAGHAVGRVALAGGQDGRGPAAEATLSGLTDLGCRLPSPESGRELGTEGFLRAGPLLEKAVARFVPDVVVAGPIQTVAFPLSLCDQAPLVAISWGSDLLLRARRDPFEAFIARQTLRRAARLLADARAVAEFAASLAGLDAARILIRPWGVDLGRFRLDRLDRAAVRRSLGLPEGAVAVIGCRALAPLYRPDVLLRGFARAALRDPRLHLLLAGDGELGPSLRALAQELGLEGRANFLGWLSPSELAQAFAAADIFVSCSVSDGSSISLLEAMAAGLPTVVSDIPGNREWVEEGETGFFAPVGDPDTVSRALDRLAALSREERAAMGLAGRAAVEKRADWSRNGPDVLRFVEDAAANRGERS